jgi:hypothetical protein
MLDILEVINNTESIYSSNSALAVLKDFERVIDELDVYVYENWEKGELVKGPVVERHWVTAEFMWRRPEMPNPIGAKRLQDFGCKLKYKESALLTPRMIKDPADFREGTKKGRIERIPVWIVEIRMPKRLMLEVFRGYHEQLKDQLNDSKGVDSPVAPAQEAEQQSIEPAAPEQPAAPTGAPA